MKKLMIILFLGIALSLPGCDNSSRDHVAPSRIASSVDIFCKRPSGIIRRHYEKPEKIEAVLHYVRMLDPNGPVEISDDVIREDYYEIVVHVYDGGARTHRQHGNTYAALHRRYWGKIQQSVGLRLGHIMALLPSDEYDVNDTDIGKNLL